MELVIRSNKSRDKIQDASGVWTILTRKWKKR